MRSVDELAIATISRWHQRVLVTTRVPFWLALLVFGAHVGAWAEDWTQLKFDECHSGDAADRELNLPLGLVGSVPLTDAVFTSPVVADTHVYIVDGAGAAFCIDNRTLEVVWNRPTRGGAANCNNVSSPAIVGPYLHFGTVAGSYYILDRSDGSIVREIRCQDPIFSAPVVVGDRAYFATLGSQVYAVDANGEVAWTWDFVKEVMGFTGDRWNGEDWREFKAGRVSWRDHFCCSRNLSAVGDMIVIPAGGRTVFLRDTTTKAELISVGLIPDHAGSEFAAAFGQSISPAGEVCVQWHRRDNFGRVEVLQLKDGKIETRFLPGTETGINLDGLLSFSSVSFRDRSVFRTRPEAGFGLTKHSLAGEETQPMNGAASICAPIVTRKHVVYGGLDGKLYVVPMSRQDETWSFATAFGKSITSPAAVCDGRIYFGCEDGHLYVLGSNGKESLPSRELPLTAIRSRLSSDLTDARFDWSTNFGDAGHTNWNDQGIKPPLKFKWIRRYEGTFKHLPVCGGGRMYTHTAEGQVFAVEQETGRLLWRKHWPHVFLSFTSPVYFRADGRERLLVPQAGMKQSVLRCLDAASGELLWEAPFTGSPSWSRQAPPIVSNGLAIYASGSGRYAPQGSEKSFVQKGTPQPTDDDREVMSWVYTHDNPYYPRDNKPRIWAWDIETGKLAWEKDFSDFGAGGNDCGLCLMDGKLYYSTFFGYSPSQRRRRGLEDGPNGMTASLDPTTGDLLWVTTKYSVTAGCTISAQEGRLYLGGYNQPDESTRDRYIFCLNAEDGKLVWKSPAVNSAVNVITVGDDFVFSNARGSEGNVLNKETGAIVSHFNMKYACTRFTVSGNFLLGTNMDMIDIGNNNQLVASGPCIDSRECVGATVSNGRLFYTSQASGLQVSLTAGAEANSLLPPWEE
ncbi:MAG: PQQ-binding-like beta-propeller repeat protein [Fuerstiella sp.]|nr:PQQ-binding-like beta-propeller repeat protein [Fuerstiella sp.]